LIGFNWLMQCSADLVTEVLTAIEMVNPPPLNRMDDNKLSNVAFQCHFEG